MVVAYAFAGDRAKADKYLNEILKTIVKTSANGQGLPYATNAGTAYGDYTMNAQNPAVSPAAWYLFAVNNFNPFRPFPFHSIEVRNISNNVVAPNIQWTSADPLGVPWVRTILLVVFLEGALFYGSFAYVGAWLKADFVIGQLVT